MTEGTPTAGDDLLVIEDLSVTFAGGRGSVRAVRNLSLSVSPGEVLAVVGESGSGKSVTASSIVGLLPRTGDVRLSGSIKVEGEEVIGLGDRALNRIRGRRVGTIFQNPASSLDPSFKIGKQIVEIARHHLRVATADALTIAREWLQRVGISDPGRVLRSYPHELSGGMRQRVMVAIACIPSPALIIADEPTTALDATIQKQVLELLASLQRELGISILIVTHDFGVVSFLSDRVVVLRRGEVVETGTTNGVLASPRHPYTRLLIESVPALGSAPAGPAVARSVGYGAEPALVRVDRVVKSFTVRDARLRKLEFLALDQVDLTIARGESVALIGESGSGKSTLARVIAGLLEPTSGHVSHDGIDGDSKGRDPRRQFRRTVQIVFQDHGSALNPRLRIGPQLVAPIVRLGVAPDRRAATAIATETLKLVGLDADYLTRYPHQLSGGQRQRIGVARALAVGPELLLLDEPTSALDVSTQAQIIDLLVGLRDRLGLTFVLIAHNLAVVELFADRVIVLKDGRIVDRFPTSEFRAADRHSVTRELVDSVLPLRRAAEAGVGDGR